ncbi:cytochrome P450 [Aspergillus cavernicola]|uniref:Cytochrome P450 n=1 Tax=Aspergillus cavernicola TaxID=176166 RepID=A0ABR4I4R9_9EURO
MLENLRRSYSTELKNAIILLIALSGLLAIHQLTRAVRSKSRKRIPGPLAFSLTKWRLAWEDWKGTRTRIIHRLHQKYGSVVRVGPNEISFNSHAALRAIYGAGSTFGRPRSFYKIFDICGQPHMFTYQSSWEHSARKKIMSQMYSKSAVLRNPVADSIQRKAGQFLDLIESDPDTASHLDKSLHYYALDNITWMVYRDCGATEALAGRTSDQHILSDIGEPTSRRLSWFQIHFPRYTSWAMSCGASLKSALNLVGCLPGKTPTAYSGLQKYALTIFNEYGQDKSRTLVNGGGVMDILLDKQSSMLGKDPITDLEIATECADHLDAGLKTTTDTLMFALWALSLPCNKKFQLHLKAEVDSIRESKPGVSSSEPVAPDMCDRLTFLDAVIKETLRLYAPIPASQPRVSSQDTVIEGYFVPAGTIVSCQAYSLHRNADIFPNPLKFDPDRWLASEAEVAEMKRWWWPFSSGARMCLGMHLAVAELKTLLVAIYQNNSTTMTPEFVGLSPTATSRFELVYDDSFPISQGMECHIKFTRD